MKIVSASICVGLWRRHQRNYPGVDGRWDGWWESVYCQFMSLVLRSTTQKMCHANQSWKCFQNGWSNLMKTTWSPSIHLQQKRLEVTELILRCRLYHEHMNHCKQVMISGVSKKVGICCPTSGIGHKYMHSRVSCPFEKHKTYDKSQNRTSNFEMTSTYLPYMS